MLGNTTWLLTLTRLHWHTWDWSRESKERHTTKSRERYVYTCHDGEERRDIGQTHIWTWKCVQVMCMDMTWAIRRGKCAAISDTFCRNSTSRQSSHHLYYSLTHHLQQHLPSQSIHPKSLTTNSENVFHLTLFLTVLKTVEFVLIVISTSLRHIAPSLVAEQHPYIHLLFLSSPFPFSPSLRSLSWAH